MDNVIPLHGRTAQRLRQPLELGSTAEIVIFPGVRFERLTAEMLAAARPLRGRRLPALQNNATAEELQ